MQQKKQRKIIIKMNPIEKDYIFSYKEVAVLQRYLSEQGYIAGRERSCLTQKQQRRLTREVKRARHLALLPFTQTV